MDRFSGRRALVTGAASGIGRETVAGLAAGGAASIICLDLDAARLDQLVAELTPSGCRITAIAGDVADDATWQRAAAAIGNDGLDCIINNAGIAQIKPVEQTSREDWERVVAVNLTSVFLSARYAFPLLRPGSAVVNVSSVAALVGQSWTPAYIASKGGIVAFTRGLAVDYASRRIRVNVVCPGPTDTPLLQRHFELLGDGDAARGQLERRIPFGRLLQASDVAPMVLFLLSPESSMITGATFVVDGGLSATFDYGGGLVQTEGH